MRSIAHDGGLRRPTLWTANRSRAVRHALWIVGLFTLFLAVADVLEGSLGLDAHAYWSAWRHHLYSSAPQQTDAYLYSPVFAQAIWPLTLLPWPAFCVLWLGGVAAIYGWLLAPLELKWRFPAFLLCSMDIVTGNIWSAFALVLVLGFRHPAAWALPVLTKVTPVVGPLWFLVRREWRALGTVLAVTIALAAISAALAPDLWHLWFRLLTNPASFAGTAQTSIGPQFDPPTWLLLAIELPIAAAITVVAARTDRPWLLPVAMLFANPVFTSNAFVVLAAIPRLLEDGARVRPARASGSQRAGRRTTTTSSPR